MAQAIIVMGVAGAGKSAVGRRLAEALDWPFYEGDDYHSPANRSKMAAGAPLDDADRAPWLDALHGLLAAELGRGVSLVLACSALKASYRRRLCEGLESQVRFVHLTGDFELIKSRLAARPDHYMKADMLASQFATLEAPAEALTLDIRRSPEELVAAILSDLGLGEPPQASS